VTTKVEVVFAGDTKNLDAAWKRAKGGAEGFDGAVAKSGSRLSRFKDGALGSLKGLAAGVAAGFAVDRIVSFGTEMFGLGQELKAFNIRAETVFGDSLGTVREFADGINESMGMGETAVLGLAAGLGDLLVPMGFTRDAAADMSSKALEMGTALAVASGEPIQAGIDAIAAAMVGEREQLKSLGIVVSEQTIKDRLMANGQAHLTGEELRQAQALALLEEVNLQSADAQAIYNQRVAEGDLKSQGLSAMTADLKEKLAAWLTPALETAVGWLTNLGTALFGSEEDAAKLDQEVRDLANSIKGLVGWLQSAVDMLGRVAGKADSAWRILQPLQGFLGKTDWGRSGGLVGKLTGWGNSTRKRHSGGPVEAGVPYIVGRTGAEEMFVPDTSGTILAGSMARGGAGGGGPIHITLQVDGREMARVVAQHTGQRAYVAGTI
jgi:hypothetical protein